MIDISCVRSYMTYEDIEEMARAALKYKFICAHVFALQRTLRQAAVGQRSGL